MLAYDKDKAMHDSYVDWDPYSLHKWKKKHVYCVKADLLLDNY